MKPLTLVPTPIGNLKDITLRAMEVLKRCDLILAEDTRQTKKLLTHFGIDTPMSSFHMHNEHKVTSRFVQQMLSGSYLAVVSDAGTPGISDPGFLLVRAALKNNLEVEVLPGATAFVPALVSSGLPCDKFVFEGFLPHKKGRHKVLEALKDETKTMVFYESPHRLVKTLDLMAQFFGNNRQICISRELTKMFEEHKRGSFEQVAMHYRENPPKGEVVITVAGCKKNKPNIS